ncbi:SAM-dependent methyltransferase [Lachnospiraceae bacterium]|nr:SAM-dependent methyltransferase [Lachnospiraceae bacterium]BDF36041.1 SAM-dependent methyltransferase [Lachnospiraceae bacterium]
MKVRPVLIKGERMIQLEMFRGNQAFHQNVDMEEAGEVIAGQMESMKQMQLETTEALYTVLISKKGKVTVKRKTQKKESISADISHNRKKQYILREGVPVPFLTDLGVMTEEGKVISSRFDKFRQINRFLEFIEDILPQLEREREVTILDFGCGKSYLTFAIYYYLHELKGYDVRIIGLDLKSDVIRRCNELSEKYGYSKLRFLEGDIADYTGVEKVDMVVTLHACDTATDFALAKAVRWDAKVILSVPCCQHELNAQVKNDVLGPVMKYGLLKERFAALVTDGLRAQYLEREGYDTQILEFIDMEHTPKNILIRAVKTGRKGENQDTIDICEEFLHVSPALGRLLDEKGEL